MKRAIDSPSYIPSSWSNGETSCRDLRASSGDVRTHRSDWVQTSHAVGELRESVVRDVRTHRSDWVQTSHAMGELRENVVRGPPRTQ